MEQTAVMPQKRIRTIPPTIQPVNVYSTQYICKRVAAYCRVSTKQEEQLNSYEVQVKYYTERINREKGWPLAGIDCFSADFSALKALKGKDSRVRMAMMGSMTPKRFKRPCNILYSLLEKTVLRAVYSQPQGGAIG